MKYNQDTSYSKSNFSLNKLNEKIYLKKIPLKINQRELLSINKQNNFKSFIINDFEIKSAHIIYNKKDIFKKKYYLVEFYRGKNGQEILLTGNKNEIKILKNFYEIYFSKILNNCNIKKRNKREIKLKFHKILKHPNFKKIKKKKIIKNYFNNLLNKDLYKYSNDNCHGDFTLSNVILNLKDKKIILIDFQTTYEENILQDISKMYQEFFLNWTSRKFSEINYLRSEITYKSIISNEFWKLIDKKMLYSLKIEFLMTILRIIPYINKNDKITFNWITKSFNTIKKFKL